MDTNISAEKIGRFYQAKQADLFIEVVAKTDSTNSDLLNRVATLTSPAALIAKEQMSGRGRAGKKWVSVPGATLAFSVAWPFHSIQSLAGLPLVVGVAMAGALQSFGTQTKLKWPNDILKEGKKLGGILVETAKADQGIWAVIGIGLNLLLPEDAEQKIGQPVASAPLLAQMDRNQLIAGLLAHLATTLVQFSEKGFESFMPLWHRYHAHQDAQVVLFDAESLQYEGVAKGIDSHGRLLLDTVTGMVAVSSGEVSLRVKE